MDNNKVTNTIILIFALIIVLLGIVVFKYKELLSKREQEIETLLLLKDLEHEQYLETKEKYEIVDSLLFSSLSAKKSITYITNVTNNNNDKNKIANFDNNSTDSLFTVNLISATKRYSNLLNK